MIYSIPAMVFWTLFSLVYAFLLMMAKVKIRAIVSRFLVPVRCLASLLVQLLSLCLQLVLAGCLGRDV